MFILFGLEVVQLVIVFFNLTLIALFLTSYVHVTIVNINIYKLLNIIIKCYFSNSLITTFMTSIMIQWNKFLHVYIKLINTSLVITLFHTCSIIYGILIMNSTKIIYVLLIKGLCSCHDNNPTYKIVIK